MWIPSIKSSQRPREVSAVITCLPDEKTETSRDAAQSHQLTRVELQLKPRLDGQQSHQHDYRPGWWSRASLPTILLGEHVLRVGIRHVHLLLQVTAVSQAPGVCVRRVGVQGGERVGDTEIPATHLPDVTMDNTNQVRTQAQGRSD